MKIVPESRVRKTDDAVCVRKSAGPERRSRWAALWRGAKAVLEPDTRFCERVNIGRSNVIASIAPQVLPQIVADNNDYIGFLHQPTLSARRAGVKNDYDNMPILSRFRSLLRWRHRKLRSLHEPSTIRNRSGTSTRIDDFDTPRPRLFDIDVGCIEM